MRKACAVIKLSRVVYLYKSNARDNSALVMRMKEITQTRVHYGYRRVHVMLRREGFRDNDLPPPSRTKVMAVSPQILENCGYEDHTIYR